MTHPSSTRAEPLPAPGGTPAATAFARTKAVLAGPIRGLDGVRGVAILLVILHHFGFTYPGRGVLDLPLAKLFRAGWCGVDLFFVLSGFLISGILMDTREASNYFASFYMRRFLRIFPLALTFLAVWFFVLPRLFGGPCFSTAHSAWYWLYLANWLPHDQQNDCLLHLWSLSVEEQFYLVWPLVVWLVPPRQLGKVCLATVLVALATRGWMQHAGVDVWIRRQSTPSRLDQFALGALGAYALRREEWHRVAARLWRPLMVAAVLVLGAVSALDSGSPFLAQGTWGFTLLGLVFACLVTGTVLVSGDGGWLARASELGGLRTLGKYSYAMYVVHFPISRGLERWPPTARLLESRLGCLAAIALGLGLSYATALLTWNLFERRFLALKGRFAAARRGARI